MACAPSEDSDQFGHSPSLIKVFAVRMKKAWLFSYPLSAQHRLIRLDGCYADMSLCWAQMPFFSSAGCCVLTEVWRLCVHIVKKIHAYHKNTYKYSRLSLSRIPRDSLKHFEIYVPRHIRFERVRKTINRATTFNKWICNLTPEVRNIYIYNNVEKRRNCSLGAISPLFHNILLPVLRFPC